MSSRPNPGHARGVIPGTRYATAYSSRHTQSIFTAQDLELLAHVNCSFLSTDGTPPTLLALKRHAQSLAVLIQKLTLTTRTAHIDNRARDDDDDAQDDGDGSRHVFPPNEAFDWLNDLTRPYANDDEWHHAPLVSLVNSISGESERGAVTYHCPQRAYGSIDPDTGTRSVLRPFLTHHDLVRHADECLTILDHEYSAEGGLLGLIPPAADADADNRDKDQDQNQNQEELRSMRGTVLGQWLLFTQHLVARMHELEINYANALDALADEAAVPAQLLTRDGPAASAEGRPVAYPQDRWVLAGAGDDVFRFVHRLLDQEDKIIDVKEKEWRDAGLVGSRLVVGSPKESDTLTEEELASLSPEEKLERLRRRGDEAVRGVTMVDVTTRYMRLREHGGNGGDDGATIFVLPASGSYPGVSCTREMESRPTVVTVAAPSYPTPVSAWQRKFMQDVNATGELWRRVRQLETSDARKDRRMAYLAQEVRRLTLLVEHYEQAYPGQEKNRVRELAQQMDALREELEMKSRNYQDLVDLVDESKLFGRRPVDEVLGEKRREWLYEQTVKNEEALSTSLSEALKAQRRQRNMSREQPVVEESGDEGMSEGEEGARAVNG